MNKHFVCAFEEPSMIKSENARSSGWVYVDIRNRDLGSYVNAAKQLVNGKIKLPPGLFDYVVRAI